MIFYNASIKNSSIKVLFDYGIPLYLISKIEMN